MSDKQTLQSQIASLKNVLASPKTDGTTRKILESGLKKAEAKLEELEKAEKLEASKQDLTPKQEAKVEEVKKETKSLAQTLKEKVAKAKEKIATTTPKATKKGGARSVAKAKDLAKQRRSTQKKQSLKDSDIESDANRYAINKTKRRSQGGRANQYGTKAENKGGIYYEKRENRYDVQNKRYAKLEGGGSTDGKNGYVAFYKGKRIEVYADTMYQAQKKAAEIFKAKKSWEVNVALAEVNGKQYVHNAYSHGGQIKVGDYVMVNNPHWHGSMGTDKPVKRKVKMIVGDTMDGEVFFSDGSNSSMKYVKKLEHGGINDFGGSTYSTEDLSGMFAKGGMTEHGLQVGDVIVSTSTEPYSIVVRNNGVEALVNLNEGTRINDIYSHKDGMKQGTRFRHSKDPMVVRSQFEEEEFEYARGGGVGDNVLGLQKGDVFEIIDKEHTGTNEKYVFLDYVDKRGKVMLETIPLNKFLGGKFNSDDIIYVSEVSSDGVKLLSDEKLSLIVKSHIRSLLRKKNYADGGAINDFGGTKYATEDLSGMFMSGGMLNKKVNEKIKHYLGDGGASPMHQWEVKTILESALTDANFHQEAKKVDSIFPMARFTESVQFSKLQEDFLKDRLEDMGREIARMSEYDGHEIINAIAFYVSMNMGRPLGQKVESLKNTMKKGGKTKFKDKVKAISKKLDGKKVAPSVQKDYGKRYSKDEAIDSAKRIAGAMRKKEMAKKKS